MIEVASSTPLLPEWAKLVEEAPKIAIEIWRDGQEGTSERRTAYAGVGYEGSLFVVVTRLVRRADGNGSAEMFESLDTQLSSREAVKCVSDRLGRNAIRLL